MGTSLATVAYAPARNASTPPAALSAGRETSRQPPKAVAAAAAAAQSRRLPLLGKPRPRQRRRRRQGLLRELVPLPP